MCDRAPGGFPWLLISILAPKSYFLGGDKSPDKFSGVDLDKKFNIEYEKLKIVNFCSNNPFALSVFFPSEKFHVCCTHPLLYPRLRQLTHFVCFEKKTKSMIILPQHVQHVLHSRRCSFVGCCPAEPHLARRGVRWPNPLFHPSSATKQLRCNYPGQRSSDRKQRGGWSHVATLICIAPLKYLLFSYWTAHVFTLEKKLIPKLRGWWVNGIDWRCANDLNVFTVSNDGKEGNWWILMNFNGDLSEVWLWGKGAQICLLISHLYRWSTQQAAHACVSSTQNELL